MPGYDPDFLSTRVPLPDFAPRLEGKILIRPELRDGVFRDYVNYTLVMHAERRTAVYVALNIDQSQLKTVERGPWDTDAVIGEAHQLGEEYYYKNRWDRGHLARRASAAWGPDTRAARVASDATMVYPNAALQFDSFNQDEWLGLEDWVNALERDRDDRITVFTGPIWGEDPLWVVPRDRPPAEVPAAFFKVVCFANREHAFEVRAFVVPQDVKAMADWSGRRRVDNQFYQTSVAEIEQLTGLLFDPIVAETNPLYFRRNAEAQARLRIRETPERIPVDRPGDLVAMDETRVVIRDAEIDVFLIAAMPDPAGTDRGAEWVSVLNLEPEPVALEGWRLADDDDRRIALTGEIGPGESLRLQGPTLAPVLLGNSGDVLTLFDAEGARVDRVVYKAEDVRPGRAVLFARPTRRAGRSS